MNNDLTIVSTTKLSANYATTHIVDQPTPPTNEHELSNRFLHENQEIRKP